MKVVYGTLCSYTGTHATVASPSSSCSGATVGLRLNKHTKLVDEDKDADAPAVNDAAAAFLKWKNGHYTVKKLEFGTSAFVFRHALFSGTNPSFTGTCTAGTLTIMTLGKHGKPASFSTDGNTKWESANTASNCATVTGGFTKKERTNVTGGGLTDGTWYAEIVNANP
jgi:hypothetical protein